MVTETPQLYKRIVEPYINGWPKSRTRWYGLHLLFLRCLLTATRVDDILSGISEQNKILYRCPEFIILPDMKWDLITLSSLYLVAIVSGAASRYESRRTRVRSMRDLRRSDIPWLKSIKREAGRVVKEKWGFEDGSLRCYIHYQPSYCESLPWMMPHSENDFVQTISMFTSLMPPTLGWERAWQ